ncbi:hypothetical protein GN244_ATG17565 [Phytophthora infestans]|uniref:Uncharacterized protein n=1 Tax=Phytophthora infestans TaxID=4787 RepID=A0A833RQI2_PHYIN|nr:hypothetical protein GN244_ATG17565 [Phytophthora infestans]
MLQNEELKGSVTFETITKSFKNTGIVPLSLEAMLAQIIGSEPVLDELPSVKFVLQVPELSERQTRKLRRISADSIASAFLGTQQAINTVEAGRQAEESRKLKAVEREAKGLERKMNKERREAAAAQRKVEQLHKNFERERVVALKAAERAR